MKFEMQPVESTGKIVSAATVHVSRSVAMRHNAVPDAEAIERVKANFQAAGLLGSVRPRSTLGCWGPDSCRVDVSSLFFKKSFAKSSFLCRRHFLICASRRKAESLSGCSSV